jgi:hypothetical protein
MTRQTSIDAYNKIRASGLLSKARWQVYNVLYWHGPMTAAELDEYLKKELNRERGGFWKRLSELRDCGVAEEGGKRICHETGSEAILWDVTKGLPNIIKGPPKPTSEEIHEALDEIKKVFTLLNLRGSPALIKMGFWLRWKANK